MCDEACIVDLHTCSGAQDLIAGTFMSCSAIMSYERRLAFEPPSPQVCYILTIQGVLMCCPVRTCLSRDILQACQPMQGCR